jgi:hypothetical protein
MKNGATPLLLSDEGVDYALDIDATQIVAEKHEAHYTYKGEKGYMPMVGHIAEVGVVIGHEFREGNAAPAAGNLEFLQACERNMPKGKRMVAVRADSAAASKMGVEDRLERRLEAEAPIRPFAHADRHDFPGQRQECDVVWDAKVRRDMPSRLIEDEDGTRA